MANEPTLLSADAADELSGYEPQVRRFAERHGLAPHLRLSRELAGRYFDLAGPILVSRIEDPESEEQWLEVGLRVRGTPAQVREARTAYTRDWLDQAPRANIASVRLAIRIV